LHLADGSTSNQRHHKTIQFFFCQNMSAFHQWKVRTTIAKKQDMMFLEAGISSKIMKVALDQQKEIADEENAERNSITAVFCVASALNAEEENRKAPPQHTLADIIIKKIKDNDAELPEEERHDPDQMDPMIAKLCKGVFLTASENDIYCSVAKLMNEYTVGKMPRAFGWAFGYPFGFGSGLFRFWVFGVKDFSPIRVRTKMDKKRDRIVNAQPFIIDDASRSPITAVFSAASALNTEEEKRVFEEEEDDIDHFYGNFDDDSYQGDVNEEDEKLFESFFVKNALPRRTLDYILIKKIKDNDAELAEEERHDPQMDPMIAKLYKGMFLTASENDIYCSVANLMSEYTIGKMPSAFVRTKMAKKRDRIVNAQPFITDDASVGSSRKRSKVPKIHQQQNKLIGAGISNKIMKVSLAQQKEIVD
ncbi:unnamed protein product, partial [Brassica napus]